MLIISSRTELVGNTLTNFGYDRIGILILTVRSRVEEILQLSKSLAHIHVTSPIYRVFQVSVVFIFAIFKLFFISLEPRLVYTPDSKLAKKSLKITKIAKIKTTETWKT